MKLIALTSIFFSILFTKRATITWLSPSIFFSLLWFLFLIIPLLFAPEYKVSNEVVWYFTILIMSICSGSIIATRIKDLNHNIVFNQMVIINNNLIIKSLCLFVIISAIGIFFLIKFSIDFYFSLIGNNLLLIPNLISIDRYDEVLNYPPFINYLIYFIYPSCILAGFLFENVGKKLWLKLICLSPIFLSIILGLIEGTRSGVLIAFSLFFSTFITSKGLYLEGKSRVNLTKLISYIIIPLSTFTVFFVLIQWLRQGLDPIMLEFVYLKIKSYFFGYLSAFSVWFENIDSIFYFSGSLSTFAGPLSLLGAIDRNLGFYEPVEINSFITTNIFTAFRGLIVDFSILGLIIIFFILGYFLQRQFQNRSKNNIFGIILISAFYSFVIYSPIISIFHYNSIFFSWILAYLVLKISLTNENLVNNC